jgi:DNA-binding phage protein
VQIMLGQRANIIQIAKAAGLSRQTVYRIKDDSAGAEAALAAWARVFGVTFQNWMLVSVAIVLVAVLIAWWRQQ